MFVCYIPDESASLCYTVGVLSSLAKIPSCVVKVKPKTPSTSTRGVCLHSFSVSVNFKMIFLHHNRIYVCKLVEVFCVYCACLFVFDFSTKTCACV